MTVKPGKILYEKDGTFYTPRDEVCITLANKAFFIKALVAKECEIIRANALFQEASGVVTTLRGTNTDY